MIGIGIFLCAILLEIGLRAGGFMLLSLQEQKNKRSLGKKDAYRIMCLGESTTFNAWPKLLEQILNQQDTKAKFSIIDKGVPGTSLAYILMQLEGNIKKYKPDMVIAMVGINDELLGDIDFYKSSGSFLKDFKTYDMIRLLWLRIIAKAKEIGIYKSESEKQTAKPYSLSNFLADGFETTDSNEIEHISDKEYFVKEAPKLEYDDDKIYVKLGEGYMKRGEYIQAEKSFNRAIEINPKNDTAYLKLGICYEIKKEFYKVSRTYGKAIEVNPKNNSAYFQLGLYNQHIEMYDKAIEMYKNAIEIKHIDQSSYFGLLSCYRRLKEYDKAEEALKELLKVNPENARAYGGLAMLYEEQGKYNSARECSRKANSLRLKRENATMRHKFQELQDIITQKGIKLVFAQYPLCSIAPLKNMFITKEDIIFVDNEKIFKDALKTAKYEDYFIDNFAGEFGHCTEKGNKLLAENIANVILKDYFYK